MNRMTRMCAVALMFVMAASVGAQEPVQQGLVPLKIQLVLSRYLGEKKLSSVPYVLWVTANDRNKTSLRMGVEVPISTGTGTFNYRSVGTNIDCSAASGAGGAYKVDLTVSDSSVYLADRDKVTPLPTSMMSAPTLRSFTSHFNILVRDGQTAQYTSATDQVSGEVLKLDATLNVLK